MYLITHVMIYLDNNATTPIDSAAIREATKWMRRTVNASTNTPDAHEAQVMLNRFRRLIKNRLRARNHHVLFTSGASESNSTVIQTVVRAYRELKQQRPHIIINVSEHKSIIACAQKLARAKEADVTYLSNTHTGRIVLDELKNAFRKNTCLVAVMFANNETGTIQDVERIGQMCKRRKVVFHCDAVQAFTKAPIHVSKCHITSLSASFHKCHGPTGVGLLLLSDAFVRKWHIQSLIDGTQQEQLRGGTLNTAGIAASYVCVRNAFRNMRRNMAKTKSLQRYLLRLLSKKFDVVDHDPKRTSVERPTAIVLGDDNKLTTTLLVALVDSEQPELCNAVVKKRLLKSKVIVSVGSACNTSSKYASHVLNAIGANKLIRRSVIRISWTSKNTKKDIRHLVASLTNIFKLK